MPVNYVAVRDLVKLFKPAERAFGDVAIIGTANTAASGPSTPIPVTNPESVSHPSHTAGANKPVDSNDWFAGNLGNSVRLALEQSPGPSKVWAVRLGSGENALTAALAEVAKLAVQIVVLANTPLSATAGRAEIEALAGHVQSVSATGGDGKERIGVAMLGKGLTDLGSGSSSLITGGMKIDRLVMVAHHSDKDAAAAVAGVIAGREPHISLILKPVAINMDKQFSDSEIDVFNEKHVNWLTDPDLLPGGTFLGEGYTLGPDKPFIDIVRTVDDVSFRLKARLIQTIGDLRISRSGLRSLVSQMTAILQPLQDTEVIDSYDVFIPILTLLDKDPASRTATEEQQIKNVRDARVVAAIVAIVYAGAIHRLTIDLKFK